MRGVTNLTVKEDIARLDVAVNELGRVVVEINQATDGLAKNGSNHLFVL